MKRRTHTKRKRGRNVGEGVSRGHKASGKMVVNSGLARTRRKRRNLHRPDDEWQCMSEIMLTKDMCRETKKWEEQMPGCVVPSPSSSAATVVESHAQFTRGGSLDKGAELGVEERMRWDLREARGGRWKSGISRIQEFRRKERRQGSTSDSGQSAPLAYRFEECAVFWSIEVSIA